MKKKLLFCAIITILITLLSCTQKKVILLTDHYWWEIAKGYFSNPDDFRRIALKNSAIADIVVLWPGESLDEILPLYLGQGDIAGVVVTPFLMEDVIFKANDFNTTFVLLEAPNKEYPPNIKMVSTTRETAYQQAGEIMALNVNTDPRFEQGVGTIFYLEGENRYKEFNAYTNGFAKYQTPLKLSKRIINNLFNKDAARVFLNNMHSRGVKVFLFSASSINPFCFDQEAEKESYIVAEDWHYSGILGDRILFSIETDYQALLDKAVQIIIDDNSSVYSEVNATLISGSMDISPYFQEDENGTTIIVQPPIETPDEDVPPLGWRLYTPPPRNWKLYTVPPLGWKLINR